MSTDVVKQTPKVIAHSGCKNGESPFWDEPRHRFIWSDIPTGILMRLDTQSGQWKIFYRGEPVGGYTVQADGSLLLFRANNIARLKPDGTVQVLRTNIDPAMERFNDCVADPEGRVFAGTIGKNQGPTGALYRIDLDGKVTKLVSGIPMSNGLAFSPDLHTLYWTDTKGRRILALDYDRKTGEVSNRRTLIKTPDNGGEPDGLKVDSQGCLWSASSGGGEVQRYAPDGRLLERIKLPIPEATSIAFGGPQLRELYITTSGGPGASDSPVQMVQKGALYKVPINVEGLQEFRSRVLLPRT